MTDVFASFRPPCLCPFRWAPTWRLHTNLYNFGKNVSPHILHKKNCCDLTLGKSLCLSTFFLFPDSGINLLNGFHFFILIYFEWRDTENQQFSERHRSCKLNTGSARPSVYQLLKFCVHQELMLACKIEMEEQPCSWLKT